MDIDSEQLCAEPKTLKKMDVSVILASYNAALFVEKSVRQIQDVLDATIYNYELIFVDDRSTDDSVSVIKRLIAEKPNCFLYEHTVNRGRGAVVSEGFKKARGEIVGFIDLDLDNPAHYLFPMILGIQKGNADVMTARRIYYWKLNPYLFIRMLTSKAYSALSGTWLQTGLKDTETGCKFFRKEKILPLLEETKNDRWFWDTEIMVRAYYAGLKILEIPTLFIRDTHYSTVRILPDSLVYLYNLWRFRPVQRQLKKRFEAEKHGKAGLLN